MTTLFVHFQLLANYTKVCLLTNTLMTGAILSTEVCSCSVCAETTLGQAHCISITLTSSPSVTLDSVAFAWKRIYRVKKATID